MLNGTDEIGIDRCRDTVYFKEINKFFEHESDLRRTDLDFWGRRREWPRFFLPNYTKKHAWKTATLFNENKQQRKNMALIAKKHCFSAKKHRGF